MNIDEVTETEVYEFGDDSQADERMSTQDYLETLLKKNNIPRTKKESVRQNPKSIQHPQPQKKGQEEEPAPPTQARGVGRINIPSPIPSARDELDIKTQQSIEKSGRDSAVSIITTKINVDAPVQP
jgi:hypothetical protein